VITVTDENLTPRKPISPKVAGIRAWAQAEAAKAKTTQSPGGDSERALVEALRAAGFDAKPVRRSGPELVLAFDQETAQALAEWLRAARSTSDTTDNP
jgi:type II secretory pathway component PulM